MTRPIALAAAVLAVVLAAAGCGIRPTGITTVESKPRAGGRADEITIYLVRDGKLTAVTRPGLPGRPYLAIGQLSVRPTRWEREHGLGTDVPGSLQPLPGAAVSGNLQVRVVPGPWPTVSKWPSTARGQIVCTADAIPGVDRVALWDPREKNALPLKCEDFADITGAPFINPSAPVSRS